ncbi:MAG: hypothetical protein AAF485_22800, partial [Chloroflexota bacterium]
MTQRYTSLVVTFVVFFIAAILAWRFLAIVDLTVMSWPVWWMSWLGATAGFTIFLLAMGYSIRQTVEKEKVKQQIGAALLGVILFGLGAFLTLTPAGLSRVTFKLYTDDIGAPQSFRATWPDPKTGLTWELPFELPTTSKETVTLELVASAEQDMQEVWLVGGHLPDGQEIPLDNFSSKGNWQQREVDWGGYEGHFVWVAKGPEAGVLHWNEQINGPFTLIFAMHNQAGQVAVRLNGELVQE